MHCTQTNTGSESREVKKVIQRKVKTNDNKQSQFTSNLYWTPQNEEAETTSNKNLGPDKVIKKGHRCQKSTFKLCNLQWTSSVSALWKKYIIVSIPKKDQPENKIDSFPSNISLAYNRREEIIDNFDFQNAYEEVCRFKLLEKIHKTGVITIHNTEVM